VGEEGSRDAGEGGRLGGGLINVLEGTGLENFLLIGGEWCRVGGGEGGRGGGLELDLQEEGLALFGLLETGRK